AAAPASWAMRACSADVTSMMTPPFSISARPTFVFGVDLSICFVFALSDSAYAGEVVGHVLAMPVDGGDGAAEAAGGLDQARGRLGAEGEADAAVAALVDAVQGARVHEDAAALRLLEEGARLERRRQGHPQPDTVLGALPAQAARQMAGQRLLERVAPA